tara:strand:+ start:1548 stop:3524 length:1977 start_codon:yes stop_codon:yes gene_type:complete
MAAGAYQNPKFYGAVPDIEGAIDKFQTSFDESYTKGYYEGGGKEILRDKKYLETLKGLRTDLEEEGKNLIELGEYTREEIEKSINDTMNSLMTIERDAKGRGSINIRNEGDIKDLNNMFNASIRGVDGVLTAVTETYPDLSVLDQGNPDLQILIPIQQQIKNGNVKPYHEWDPDMNNGKGGYNSGIRYIDPTNPTIEKDGKKVPNYVTITNTELERMTLGLDPSIKENIENGYSTWSNASTTDLKRVIEDKVTFAKYSKDNIYVNAELELDTQLPAYINRLGKNKQAFYNNMVDYNVSKQVDIMSNAEFSDEIINKYKSTTDRFGAEVDITIGQDIFNTLTSDQKNAIADLPWGDDTLDNPDKVTSMIAKIAFPGQDPSELTIKELYSFLDASRDQVLTSWLKDDLLSKGVLDKYNIYKPTGGTGGSGSGSSNFFPSEIGSNIGGAFSESIGRINQLENEPSDENQDMSIGGLVNNRIMTNKGVKQISAANVTNNEQGQPILTISYDTGEKRDVYSNEAGTKYATTGDDETGYTRVKRSVNEKVGEFNLATVEGFDDMYDLMGFSDNEARDKTYLDRRTEGYNAFLTPKNINNILDKNYTEWTDLMTQSPGVSIHVFEMMKNKTLDITNPKVMQLYARIRSFYKDKKAYKDIFTEITE